MNSEFEETALAYILGELDEAQVRAFEKTLDGDPKLSAEVKELALAHETLALASPRREAPANVPDLILSARKPSSPEGKTPSADRVVSFWSNPGWTVAAGFAVCLATYAFLTLRGEQQQVKQLRQEIAEYRENWTSMQDLQVIRFDPQKDDFVNSQAVALWDPRQKTAFMVVGSLPDLPHDHAYQIWALDDTKDGPIPGETFGSWEEFTAFKGFGPSPEGGRSLRFAVSIEPTGGSPAPTGPVVLVSAEVESRSG